MPSPSVMLAGMQRRAVLVGVACLVVVAVAVWWSWPRDESDPGCAVWDRHNAEVARVAAEIEAGERDPLGEEFVDVTRSAAVEVVETTEDHEVLRVARALVRAIDDGDPWLAEDGAWMELTVMCNLD